MAQRLCSARDSFRRVLPSVPSANPLRSRLSASVSLGVGLLGRACSCHPYSRAGSAPGPGRLLPGLAQLLSEPALLGGGALCIATGRCRASGAAWRRRARGPWPGRAGDTRCSPLMDQAMGRIARRLTRDTARCCLCSAPGHCEIYFLKRNKDRFMYRMYLMANGSDHFFQLPIHTTAIRTAPIQTDPQTRTWRRL